MVRSGCVTHEGPERLSHHVSISVLTGVFPPDVVEKVMALVSAGLYEEVRDPWSPGWNGSRAGGLSEGGHAELGRGIGPRQGAAQAAVLVDAVRVVGAAAITDGNSLGTAYDETRNGPSPLPSKR